jgi:hypothetical protein
MGIPVIAGRTFSESEDADDNQRSVVINRAMAAYFWTVENAVGQRVRYGLRARYTIIGICEDVKDNEPGSEVRPTFYFPGAAQNRGLTFFVRSSGAFNSLGPEIRKTILAVDSNVDVGPVVPVDTLMRDAVAGERYRAILVNLFAISAGGLALIGLYGVVSRFVVNRTREISIRIALGAQPRTVLWLVLNRTVGLVSTGIGTGLVVAIAFRSSYSGSARLTCGPTWELRSGYSSLRSLQPSCPPVAQPGPIR